jgi:hypothetical protein
VQPAAFRPCEVADGFGAILVAVLRDHAIEFCHEIVIEGNGHALH